MATFKEELTQKLGPLPVYAWILVSGAAIYIGYRYYSSKKAAAANSTTTDTTDNSTDGTSFDQYAAGVIGADYDLANQLGENNAIIASNTGATVSNTKAVASNTGATNANTSAVEGPQYGVVDYGGYVYELGKAGGIHLTPAQYQKIGRPRATMTKNPVVDFGGTIYTIGASHDPYPGIKPAGIPARLTPAQYATWRKRHHNSKALVLSPNAKVSADPSKVKN